MMTFIKNTNKQKHIPTGYQLVNIYDTLKRYKLYTDKVEANVEGKVEITFEGEDDIED